VDDRNTPEEWRDIPGYEGLYRVSNMGRVYSTRRGGRMLKPTLRRKGYLAVALSRNGSARMRLIHQLVLEAFVGPRPEGFVTRHLDGDPANNTLDNLRWGTYAENVRDSIEHGTHFSPARLKTHCAQGHEFDEVRRGKRGCSICRLAESRDRRRANYPREREKLIARQKEFYKEHAEEIKAYQKRYYEENREKVRAQQRAYRLRKKAEKAAQEGGTR
jgi:NUMOD4 motif./HNH endonuclease.